VPSGLVKQQHGMRARRHTGGDLGEMQAHRRAIAARQDQGRTLALLRANGAKNVG